MNVLFPSREFDDAVAAVCHGLASDEQMGALNELLRANPAARDEYLLRVELHARLASDTDLFASAAAEGADTYLPVSAGKGTLKVFPLPPLARGGTRMVAWVAALAACLTLLTVLGWAIWLKRPVPKGTTSIAVAVLSRAVDAQWNRSTKAPAVSAALEPGWLRLKAGLAQVDFYSGARLVIQGPAELRLISPNEAFCPVGLVSAEVPPQALGFSVGTPQMTVVDLGTAFGLDVKSTRAEVHVFKGTVECQVEAAPTQSLREGEAAAVEGSGVIGHIPINPAIFAKAFDLQRKSLAGQELRYEQWRVASARRNRDRSLLVHFDLENVTPSEWMLPNVANQRAAMPDAIIVGCQWTEGRWPGKRALEFRSVSDRVRFNVPGEFQALTLLAWVGVKGLDRQFNSLFMCDGFDPGKIHWQIRNDGVLDLGVQGPRVRDVQIFASPPVVGFTQFGQWMHLAAVVDGERRQVVHYVNGTAVRQHALRHPPPYRLGPAELGNWNPGDIPNKPPFLIRHFSGAMDEFALFNRALNDAEIRQLYLEGAPQPEPGRMVSGREPRE